MKDQIIVQPGEVIDRSTGQVAQLQTLPISPTETVNRGDPQWDQAVKQNCGDQTHTFIKQSDGTYKREVD